MVLAIAHLPETPKSKLNRLFLALNPTFQVSMYPWGRMLGPHRAGYTMICVAIGGPPKALGEFLLMVVLRRF